MGQTTGKLSASKAVEQQSLMVLQRAYVNVESEPVDFSDPTKSANDDVEDTAEADKAAAEADKAAGKDDVAGTEEEVSYAKYRPSKFTTPGMQPHPSNAVENGSLATVAPPDVTYQLEIAVQRAEVVAEGKLSDLQLEFVAYACQRHDTDLASGSRGGFFLGDGAGMGKGRQLAGLIMENCLQGRKKHIWVSTNIDLKVDAERDLGDLGMDDIDVFGLPASVKTDMRAKHGDGVLFCTYSSLSKGCSQKSMDEGVAKRLEQVVDWCGEDFDGLLLFDEAHRAKNLVSDVPGTETAAGRAVFWIQKNLPRARVVYCSATAVSEPRNYAYMARLGLWGPRSPFPGHEHDEEEEFSVACIQNFISTVERRGVGAMELCALHLKQQGALLCRTLSFEGTDFEVCEADLSPAQQRQYDRAAKLWQYLHTRTETKLAAMAFEVGGVDPDAAKKYSNARKQAHSILWGGHQRFFRSLITSFKVPKLVALAKEALAEGKCVVIGLQSTGEAHAKRAAAREAEDKTAVDGAKKLKGKTAKAAKAEVEEEAEEAEEAEDSQESMLSAPQETLKFVIRRIWEAELEEAEKLMAEAAADALNEAADEAEMDLMEQDDDADSLFSDEGVKCVVKKRSPKSPPPKKSRGRPFKQSRRESDETLDLTEADVQRASAPEQDAWGWDDSESGSEDECSDVVDMTEDADLAMDDGVSDVEWITKLMKLVDELELPGNALDVIVDDLGGVDCVAEMSGRSSRLVRTWKGALEYQKRTMNGVSMDEQNIYEREEFQAGRKLVAIISDAASSGISLHAEKTSRVKNQTRRVHITLELPWSADKTIQQMGRSHRSNQSSAPQYKLLVSPLGGERRFCAAVVKRLESLGALTQGDRRASGVTKGWQCFNVDTAEGAISVLDMYHHASSSCGELLGRQAPNEERPLVKPPKLPKGERIAIAKLCVANAALIGAHSGWIGQTGGEVAVADELHLLHAARLWLSLVGINIDE
ncbi:P-loop containing NTP hydrolase pore-1-domain-containing protein [Pelagophyceae sp. CCMP2097]|nr:P-loop containing NTP hydrolase pore-1-domain-containing protein [Pelagophyceae sp. CCMP2097]